MNAVDKIQPNSFVVLDYTLRDDDGEVLDQSAAGEGQPIEYVHGYGMLVPGLEAALVGMAVGDEKNIVVPADEGFGERDDDLVLEIHRSEFPNPNGVKAGEEFVAESDDGDELVMRVLEVKDDSVRVDANHPLAGKTLHYSVKVRSLRDATAEEIEHAADDFEEAQDHVHGPGCNHDHDHDHAHAHDHAEGKLITLGTKKNDLIH